MLLTFIIFSVFYILFVGYFALGQIKLFYLEKQQNFDGDIDIDEPVSIVVALHNEENNVEKIFQLISRQNYPQGKIELILVDDESTDRTVQKINWHATDCDFDVKVIKSKRIKDFAPKKLAITRGIENASNEIIALIDADISGGSDWLKSTVHQMKESNADLQPGIVLADYHEWKHPFASIQALDFGGLVACGLGSAGWNKPFLCNGANLALKKSAFMEIEGYDGYEKILSGDDVFLLEKMRNAGKKISYNLLEESRILTKPKKNIKSFLLQRSRWASKNMKFDSPFLLIALLISYFYFIVVPVAAVILPFTQFFPGLLVKLLMDILLIMPFLKRFDSEGDLFKTIFSAELFQFFYIPVAGIMSVFKKYDWGSEVSPEHH